MKYRIAAGVFALLVWSTGMALGGGATLHPSGFGPHSYAAWKAHEGQPDSAGNKDQALYLQKMTATTTEAAGVVLIKGFEGMPVSDLTGLAWDHRTDGHCGAGAPRWNIGYDANGTEGVAFLGCTAANHSQVAPNWCHDTQPSPAAGVPSGATITYLAIVFDEGPEVPNNPTVGCLSTGLSSGFIYLDNITVQTASGTYLWTSATDNGQGGTTSANTTLTASELELALGAPLTTLLR